MTQQAAAPISFSLEQRSTLSGVGLRALFKLEETIGLSEDDIQKVLGRPNKTQYKEWRRSAMAREAVVLPSDTLNRVRATLIVCQNIYQKWPKSPEKVKGWLTTPHSAPIFQKKSPLSMLGEEDITNAMNVLRYVSTFSNAPDTAKASPKPVRRRKKET